MPEPRTGAVYIFVPTGIRYLIISCISLGDYRWKMDLLSMETRQWHYDFIPRLGPDDQSVVIDEMTDEEAVIFARESLLG